MFIDTWKFLLDPESVNSIQPKEIEAVLYIQEAMKQQQVPRTREVASLPLLGAWRETGLPGGLDLG